ncbi:MAG: hypothetical protein JOZ72_09715 [Alphaproteobacteria bacterium]|nr:hypothetical protein [Alphaproteobacteria bacterium]
MRQHDVRGVGDQHARLAVAAVASFDQLILDRVVAGAHHGDAALAAHGTAFDRHAAQGGVDGIEHDAVSRAVLRNRVQREPEAARDMEGRMHRVAAGVSHDGLDPGIGRGHRRDARPSDTAGHDAERLDAFAIGQVQRGLADIVERRSAARSERTWARCMPQA